MRKLVLLMLLALSLVPAPSPIPVSRFKTFRKEVAEGKYKKFKAEEK